MFKVQNRKNQLKARLILLYTLISMSALAFVMIVSLSVNATLYTGNVVANVVVSNTCFTSGTPSAFSFPSLPPGSSDNTNTAVTDTDNGGNAASTLYIAGTGGSGTTLGYWTGPGTNTIPVGQTDWNAASQPSYSGTALSNTLASTSITLTAPNTVNPITSANIYLGVSIPSGTAAGLYTQTIQLENSCSGNIQTANVVANVVVQGVCYISLSPSSISFGTLTPTATYNTNQIVTDTDNGGNVAANILLEGTGGSGATLGDWLGPGSNVIPVGNTLYSASSQPSYSGAALSNALTNSNIVIAAPNVITTSTSANVFFGLGVPAGTAGGTYTQNILIENSC